MRRRKGMKEFWKWLGRFALKLVCTLPLVTVVVFLCLYILFALRPLYANSSAQLMYMDSIVARRNNSNTDLSAHLASDICHVSKGTYRIDCEGLSVDGQSYPGYWIEVNDNQMTFIAGKNGMECDIDAQLVKSRLVLAPGEKTSDDSLLYKSYHDRALIAFGENHMEFGSNASGLEDFSKVTMDIKGETVAIYPYRNDNMDLYDAMNRTYVNGEVFNPYAYLSGNPEQVTVTNGTNSFTLTFDSVVTANRATVSTKSSIPVSAVEFSGVKDGNVSASGIADLSYYGDGDINLYYFSDPSTYNIRYQQNSFVSDNDSLYFEAYYGGGKSTGGIMGGHIRNATIAQNSVFPFVGFFDWFLSNLLIAPFTVLTIVSLSISLILHFEKKDDDD